MQERDRLLELVNDELHVLQKKYEPGVISVLDNQKVVTIRYPVLSFPDKITSLSIDKTPSVSGILQGIKGQYLLLDSGVMNVRKFGGYEVSITTV